MVILSLSPISNDKPRGNQLLYSILVSMQQPRRKILGADIRTFILDLLGLSVNLLPASSFFSVCFFFRRDTPNCELDIYKQKTPRPAQRLFFYNNKSEARDYFKMGKRKQLKDGDVEMGNTTRALGENDSSSEEVYPPSPPRRSFIGPTLAN